VQAVRDHFTAKNSNNSTEGSALLSFKKDDIIKLVEKSDRAPPDGWLNGSLNDQQGLFPLDYVRPVNRLELCDLNKV
jgi:hypothetical protein